MQGDILEGIGGEFQSLFCKVMIRMFERLTGKFYGLESLHYELTQISADSGNGCRPIEKLRSPLVPPQVIVKLLINTVEQSNRVSAELTQFLQALVQQYRLRPRGQPSMCVCA